jgi:hypothetical protein
MYKNKKLVVENIKKENSPRANNLRYKDLDLLGKKFWVTGAIISRSPVINRRDRLNKSLWKLEKEYLKLEKFTRTKEQTVKHREKRTKKLRSLLPLKQKSPRKLRRARDKISIKTCFI